MNQPGFIDGRMSLLDTLNFAVYSNQGGGEPEPSFDILTDVPGLRFLFDGDNATLSGSNVEGITNQVSGQANAVKLADGSRPSIVDADLNGHATIDFGGSHALKINVTDIVTVDMTWFVVFKTDGVSGASRRPLLNCWSGSSSGFSVNIVNSTAEFFIRSTSSQAFTDTAGWHVMMVKAKNYGTGRSMRVFKVDNGTPVNSVQSAFANLAFNMFFGTNNDQSLFYDGKIAEIIGIEDVVTQENEANIYTYLNEKYGLSVTTTMPEYTFSSGSLTYSSSYDSITNLNYQFAVSGKTFGKPAPLLILMHGYSDEITSFTTEIKQRMANLGFVLYIPSMRGRAGADGTRDSSGREILDIYDMVQKALTDHPDLTDSEKVNIWGGSGGGGNAVACAAKLPELFGVVVDAFGITDYIFDYAATAWFEQATAAGPVQQQLELDILGAADRLPADYLNEAKSRDHRYSAINNFEGKGHIIHDAADTAVEIVQSEELWKQVIDQGRTANWSIHGSAAANGVRLTGDYEFPVQNTNRYTHGYPASTNPGLIASEEFWKAEALSLGRPSSKTSGTYRVSGFIKTRKFELFLGLTQADGLSCEADLTFNYNTNSYTITPIFHGGATEMEYSFEDDIGRVSSGTITEATPFTPA